MSEATDSSEHGQLPPPQVLALNICDGVWTDPWTGKRTLIGIFSVIHANQFPVQHPIITIHAALTNGHGKVKIKVRLIDTDELRAPVVDFPEQELDFIDPRAVVDIQSIATGIVFPDSGEYRVQLLGNGELLSERRIIVMDIRVMQK